MFYLMKGVKGRGGGGGGRWDDGRVGGYEGENGIVVFKFMNEYVV